MKHYLYKTLCNDLQSVRYCSMTETMDNGNASTTVEVKAGEIMFSIGQTETPKKNKKC